MSDFSNYFGGDDFGGDDFGGSDDYFGGGRYKGVPNGCTVRRNINGVPVRYKGSRCYRSAVGCLKPPSGTCVRKASRTQKKIMETEKILKGLSRPRKQFASCGYKKADAYVPDSISKNCKTRYNKKCTPYQAFVRDMMPEVMKRWPNCNPRSRMGIIADAWYKYKMKNL